MVARGGLAICALEKIPVGMTHAMATQFMVTIANICVSRVISAVDEFLVLKKLKSFHKLFGIHFISLRRINQIEKRSKFNLKYLK